MNEIYETAYKYIQEIVNNIAPADPDKDDLIQDIAMAVLEKPPEAIETLYKKNQLKYFISKMITNNIFSCSSPYYYLYKKNKHISYEEGNIQ